jgi:hypothetical protein
MSTVCAKYAGNTGVYTEGVIVLKTNSIKNANLFQNMLLYFKMDILGSNTGKVSVQMLKNGVLHSTYSAQLTTANVWTTLSFSPETNTSSNFTVYADSITELRIIFPAYSGLVYLDNFKIRGAYSSIDNFDSERNIPISSTALQAYRTVQVNVLLLEKPQAMPTQVLNINSLTSPVLRV